MTFLIRVPTSLQTFRDVLPTTTSATSDGFHENDIDAKSQGLAKVDHVHGYLITTPVVGRFDRYILHPSCQNRESRKLTMSPHKVDVLPSPLALPSYGIWQNGFLPAEAPLRRLPHIFYEPWERVMDQLPALLEAGCVRERVDALPVLGTFCLDSERELQRAYSILAMIAQAYIWQGPKPSEVGVVCIQAWTGLHKLTINSGCLQQSQYLFSKLQQPWKSYRSRHTQHSTYGTGRR
jgi:hypothetical protein